MSYNDFTNVDFRSILKQKKELIQRRTFGGFSETDDFKKLLLNLSTYRNSNVFKGEYKTILITKEEINNLADDIYTKIDATFKNKDAIVNNHFIVDRNFTIIKLENHIYENSNESREIHTELSKEYCVFLINPVGIHYFIDGDDNGDTIFFTPSDYESYKKLKKVSELNTVIDDYRNRLTIRDRYRKFFALNTLKRSLHIHLNKGTITKKSHESFLSDFAHLLNNKPEDLFREDLRIFLTENLNAKVLLGKEMVLENFKRIDIFIYDEFGELYFIEVKWVGISIHAYGEKFGTEYKSSDINPAAVIQTLNYLKELNEKGNKIKIGYLAVFDARIEANNDTCKDFDDSTLPDDLKPYYPRFEKIPDFKIENSHPY